MARPIRLEYPGAIYHVSSRMIGNWPDGRERLFVDRRDYLRILERLEERVADFGIRLIQEMGRNAESRGFGMSRQLKYWPHRRQRIKP
jgi:hypothetical protein